MKNASQGSYARYKARAKQVRARLSGLVQAYPSADFSAALKALHNADVVLEHFQPTVKGDHELVVFNLRRAEELGEAAPVAAKLPALLKKFEHGREEKVKAEPKVPTGRFIGDEVSVKPARLNGPNILRHITPEMADALRRQRQLAGREVPKRGAAIHIVNGHKKRAGKKG